MPTYTPTPYRDARLDGVVGNDPGNWTGRIDTNAVNIAAARGRSIVFKKGFFRMDNMVSFVGGTKFYGEGIDETILLWPTNYTANVAALALSVNCVIEGMTIMEYEPDPSNGALATATQYGLRMGGMGNRVQNVKVDGFNWPLQLFNNEDNNDFIDCIFTRGRVWNELQAASFATFTRCEFSNMGQHGMKVQKHPTEDEPDTNKPTRVVTFNMCEFIDNGLRDISKGGSEDTSGVGVSLFDGGSEYIFDKCYFARNAGSGVSQKGSNDFSHGCTFRDCVVEDNLPTNDTPNGGHGYELGTGSGYNQRNLRIIGGMIRRNRADGIFCHGADGLVVSETTIVENGNVGFRAQTGTVSDIDLIGNTIAGNFFANVLIGNSGTTVGKDYGINIIGGQVSGVYNPSRDSPRDIPLVTETVTFDNTTNTINAVGHGFSDRDCISFRDGTLPDELEEKKFYFVTNALTDSFQICEFGHGDDTNGTPIEFTDDGSGTITASTIHTEWTMINYLDASDMLYKGVRFYPGWNNNGVRASGDFNHFENCRFFKFVRESLRIAGAGSTIEKCSFYDFEDTGVASYAAIVIEDDADVYARELKFGSPVDPAQATAIRLQDNASLTYKRIDFADYNTQINNVGTGSATPE